VSAALHACVEFATTLLADAVRNANARRATAFDPLKSLCVTELEVDQILSQAAVGYPAAATLPVISELSALGLGPLESGIAALAVAGAAVPRIERVIGFLHDDLTRRSLSVGLLLELFCADLDERALLLAALAPSGRLRRLAVIELMEEGVPLEARIRIDPGMLSRLRGGEELDCRLQAVATYLPGRPPESPATEVHGIEEGIPLTLWGAADHELVETAAGLAATLASPTLSISPGMAPELLGVAAREAILTGALLVIRTDTPAAALVAGRSMAGLPLCAAITAPAGVDGHPCGAHLRVSPRRGPRAFVREAAPLPYGRRVVPQRGLDRLVLPNSRLRLVRSISRRVRMRDIVFHKWRMDGGSSRGGVRALFAGPPGTGKTLAAEAVAAELQRDLYVIDLSLVVSKYIGETERALSNIFAEATRSGVCLFFDEADALFGKRTSVQDAHDRYANTETAYLLQALDEYPGIALLATNMLANIDEALLRRIDVQVDFPMPDVDARRKLWRIALGEAPRDDLNVELIAERFPLSGGAIQNAALSAAFEAADEKRGIGTLDLLRAARDEFAKAGKIAGRMELGDHYDLLMTEA
jgi:hypothetical protein